MFFETPTFHPSAQRNKEAWNAIRYSIYIYRQLARRRADFLDDLTYNRGLPSTSIVTQNRQRRRTSSLRMRSLRTYFNGMINNCRELLTQRQGQSISRAPPLNSWSLCWTWYWLLILQRQGQSLRVRQEQHRCWYWWGWWSASLYTIKTSNAGFWTKFLWTRFFAWWLEWQRWW